MLKGSGVGEDNIFPYCESYFKYYNVYWDYWENVN
jgi:hypothetical protein